VKVSDELVERVAKALEASMADIGFVTTEYEAIIISQTIAALSTPEFARAILDGLNDAALAVVVLPRAERLLQKCAPLELHTNGWWSPNGFGRYDSLLEAYQLKTRLLDKRIELENYRAAKGE
jgi:hypothetical protein